MVEWWTLRGVQAVLDATQDAVVVVDRDGEIVCANRAAGRLVGVGGGELVGRRAAEALVPADRSAVLTRALDGIHVRAALTSLRREDGSTVPVQIEAAPDGEVVVLVLQDQGERIETQIALADAQQRLSDLQSLGRVGLWRWGPETDEVQWSDQMHRIHGLDPLAFAGTLRDHLAPVREDMRDEVRRALTEALSTRQGATSEYVIVRPDGDQRWIVSRTDPLLDDRGRVVALTGISQDVTDDRQARAEIEAARTRLDRFASVLAHDLRAPLSTIAAFAAVILDEQVDADEATTLVGRIHENTLGAIELLDGVLAEARGGDDTEGGDVDLGAVVRWVVSILDQQLTSTGSRVEVDDDMPTVEGREPLLRQAVLNLVGNAIKYRHADRGARIRVSAVSDGSTVELRVDDDGPGIPHELRGAVLDDGYRAERDVERGIGGTGMGLATVQSVAERHGTEVTVGDSDLGGARFAIRLRPARTSSEPRTPGAG